MRNQHLEAAAILPLAPLPSTGSETPMDIPQEELYPPLDTAKEGPLDSEAW
jgi:hypothetical protein